MKKPISIHWNLFNAKPYARLLLEGSATAEITFDTLREVEYFIEMFTTFYKDKPLISTSSFMVWLMKWAVDNSYNYREEIPNNNILYQDITQKILLVRYFYFRRLEGYASEDEEEGTINLVGRTYVFKKMFESQDAAEKYVEHHKEIFEGFTIEYLKLEQGRYILFLNKLEEEDHAGT